MRSRSDDLLRAALAQAGCALCRLESDHIKRYLDGFMYEDVTDVDLRAKMRAAQGFCREHALRAIEVRDSLGLAIIYQDILSNVERQLASSAPSPQLPVPALMRRRAAGPGHRLAQAIEPERACPACAVREEMTAAGLQALVSHLLEPEIRALYDASSGLCLLHLRRALALCNDQAALKVLIARQSQVMKDLGAELQEYIRKHDYRFRHEGMAGESDSWRRAIEMVIGDLP